MLMVQTKRNTHPTSIQKMDQPLQKSTTFLSAFAKKNVFLSFCLSVKGCSKMVVGVCVPACATLTPVAGANVKAGASVSLVCRLCKRPSGSNVSDGGLSADVCPALLSLALTQSPRSGRIRKQKTLLFLPNGFHVFFTHPSWEASILSVGLMANLKPKQKDSRKDMQWGGGDQGLLLVSPDLPQIYQVSGNGFNSSVPSVPFSTDSGGAIASTKSTTQTLAQ